jgi:hydroxymethylpyrimidine pyrophosphatase-like HAD family hydrolase
MRRAGEHLPQLVDSLEVRTVYTDLDGTLLGPGGSLFAVPGGTSREPALARAALLDAGVDLVVVSGRTRDQIREVARVVGAVAYVAELGGLLVYRHERTEEVVRAEGVRRGRGTAAEAIERSGAAGFLLEAYGGRLEPHAPWAFLDRECSVLLRGNVELQEARTELGSVGYGWLDLLDNGILSGGDRFPALQVEEVHVYHLVPAGVSKRSAIALDRARRKLEPDQCVVVGDSPSDAAAAAEVGAVFIVANGEPAMRGEDLPDNVFLLDRTHGLGFADAVLPFATKVPKKAASRRRY